MPISSLPKSNVSIFCEFLLSFKKDSLFRFGIMDIPLDNELNLLKVHHIDILGHLLYQISHLTDMSRRGR